MIRLGRITDVRLVEAGSMIWFSVHGSRIGRIYLSGKYSWKRIGRI